MDLPKGPQDQELRNIIDKLAQFVARNGPEFEQMTKDKQRDNPRFYFLFGGEYFNYYQYRVTSEQAVIRNKDMQQQQHVSGQHSAQHSGQHLGQHSGQHLGPQYLQQQLMASQAPPPQTQQSVWQNNNSINNMTMNNINSMNNMPNANNLSQSNRIAAQINEAQEQIRQSETNLAAQHQVLMQQKQIMIDDAIKQSQDDNLRRLADEFSVSLTEFENVLQPITESCTKESIANGKMWIFNHCNSTVHYEVIAKYLLKRITLSGSTFDAKLHLMYLINDLFNHCMRKGDNSLKRVLDTVIEPIFCCTFIDADDDKQQKLTKLLKLWEMNQYFDRAILDQLQNPQMALANYKSALCNEFSDQISQITSGQLAKYSQLQKQHNDFVAHIQTKIQQLQHQKQQMVANVPQMPVSSLSLSVPSSGLPLSSVSQMMLPNQSQLPPRAPLQFDQPSRQQHQFDQQPPRPPLQFEQQPPRPPLQFDQPQPRPQLPFDPQPPRPPLQFDQQPPRPPLQFDQPSPASVFLPLVHQQQQQSQANANQTSTGLLMSQLHQNSQMPVRLGSVPQLPQSLVAVSQPFGGPPVGGHFPSAMPNPQFFSAVHNSTPIPKEVIPDVPYYELPAGLMAPLVKLEDFEYNPIVPKDIRLPPPAPPNERLLQAVEMFYAPPTHERPRNSDGWEQLGLYEFFKAKSQAKKANDTISSNSSETESFEVFPALPQNSNNANQQTSQPNNEISSKQNQIIEQSLPSPPNYNKHRSPSPLSSKRRYKEDKSPKKSRRRSRSRSPTANRRHRSHSRSRSRSRSKSPNSRSYRSRSRSRSLSPPNFSSYGKPDLSRLDESNKGHQMLKKMGWSGITGLGVSEQGIQDPIRGGEVRDKHDMYKGVGIEMNDPYEKFRKNKGQAFMQRITQGRSDK